MTESSPFSRMTLREARKNAMPSAIMETTNTRMASDTLLMGSGWRILWIPSYIENIEPMVNKMMATINDQKYNSPEKPKGCRLSG